MKQIKELLEILIESVKKQITLPIEKREGGLCFLTSNLRSSSNLINCLEEEFIDELLHEEIRHNLYQGFISIYSKSVNNKTDKCSTYFFERKDFETRLKWLEAVIKNVDEGKLCKESLDLIRIYYE